MENIKNLIDGHSGFDEKQIMSIFNQVGNEGDIIILKNDGLRVDKKYTVVITSGTGTFESIRNDSDDLVSAIKQVLTKYCQVKGC